MKIKHTTTQAKLVDKYFTYYGCKLDHITAIDSENSIMFIVVANGYNFMNLVPRCKPDEINIFYNNVRIKFNKTVENGN
jgi:hypothetical protein